MLETVLELFILFILLSLYIICIIFTVGQFTVPSLSGECCPPTTYFNIEKIDHNKGIMFGGVVTGNDGTSSTSTNSVYIFNVTHNTIVSYYIIQYYIIPVLYIVLYSLILILLE